jgi:RNA polymerase sigma factor (TIGR02999 family)
VDAELLRESTTELTSGRGDDMQDQDQHDAEREGAPDVDPSPEGASEPVRSVEYQQLRRLAQRMIAQEPKPSTLTATALVHELFLKVVQQPEAGDESMPVWSIRFAAHAMRQILIDRARSRRSRQRVEGKYSHQNGKPVTPSDSVTADEAEEFLRLELVLREFAERFPENAEVVRLKVFGNASLEQVAELMGLSRATAYRKWEFSKAWLSRQMRDISATK